MSEQIELKVKIDRKLYYDDKSSFGVYAMSPVTNKRAVILNQYDNFVVNGNCPELVIGSEYEMIIEPTIHKKYGNGYSFVKVHMKKPTSINEQHTYLRAIVSEKLAEQLIKKYPNEKILDLIKEDKIDFSDIKGMAQKTYDKVKRDLFENIEIQEAIVELNDLNISFTAMKKLIEHYGDPAIVIEKVKKNIYALCAVKFFGFIKVDQYAMNRGDDKNNPERIKASFSYLLNQEEQTGHCWISTTDLIDEAQKLLEIEKVTIAKVLNEFMDEKYAPVIKVGDRIALRQTYQQELYIKDKLKELLNSNSKFNVGDFSTKIKGIEDDQGFAFTDEQKEAIQLAVKHNVFILNGKGGVGKTATLKGILGVLNKYRHVACALSGKASKIMNSHGLNASTIHRMLGMGKDGFAHNEESPLEEDIIVMDEASMCSASLFYSVVRAIENGSKLIIVGDSGQLASIGSGAIFDDLIRSRSFPMKELTVIQRQAAKSGILSEANKIREGKQIVGRYESKTQVYGELKDFVLFPVENKSIIKDLVLDVCHKYNGDTKDFQVLCGLKNRGDLSVKNLNNEIQKIFNNTNQPFIKRGSYHYYKGDRVIQNGNNYDAGEFKNKQVFNGTLGEIAKLDSKEGKVWIEFEGVDELIPYDLTQMDQIELAYAITVHKSQGSTIKNVVFAFDYSSYTLLSRQMVYTGVTRASKACVLICETGALHHAIRTDHGGSRRTFLYDLLREE